MNAEPIFKKIPYPHKQALLEGLTRASKPAGPLPTIHFVSLNIWTNDAVSNHTLELAIFLSALGYPIQMYGLGIHEDFQAFHRPREVLLEESPQWTGDHVVFYQYSIGDEFLAKLRNLPVRKVVYYHGITPPELLVSHSSEVARFCQKGLDELPLLESFDAIFSNSDFNLLQVAESLSSTKKQQLLALRRKRVLPPFLTLARLPGPARLDSQKPISHFSRLLYVGRLYPHKNVSRAIEFLVEYRKQIPNAQLAIVGAGQLDSYRSHLEQYAHSLLGQETTQALSFFSNASDSALNEFYQNSGVLLQFSNHEGFGMPLVEAMKTGTLVVTHDKGALRETLKNTGVIIDSESLPEAVTHVIRMIQDDQLRNQALSLQCNTFESHYSDSAVLKLYMQNLLPALENKK